MYSLYFVVFDASVLHVCQLHLITLCLCVLIWRVCAEYIVCYEIDCSSSQSKLYIATYTQCSNYNSHRDACVVHKWCTLFESAIASVYSTCTPHNTQTTIGIRMYAWFASEARRSSSQSEVHIPTYASKPHNTQPAIDIMVHVLFTSDAHRLDHNPKCIYPHTYT